MQFLLSVISLLGRLFGIHRKDTQLEPLIDGYEGLSKGNAQLIHSLGKRIGHLERDNEKLNKAIEECNQHRSELEKRLKVLEKKAATEKRYSHDRAHEHEDAMKALKIDMEAAGIEPIALAQIIEKAERRHADEQHQRYLDSE